MIKVLRLSFVLVFFGAASSAYAEDVRVSTNNGLDLAGPFWGVHAGYLLGRDKADISPSGGGAITPPYGTTSTTVHGAALGFLGGYNWQNGDVVYGIEADIGYLANVGLAESPGQIPAGFDLNWNAHIRGRYGMIRNDRLQYLAGGLAFTRYDMHAVAATLDRADPQTTLFGVTLGAGIEGARRNGGTWRFEYLLDYYPEKQTFDGVLLLGGGGPPIIGAPITQSQVTTHTFRYVITF